MIDGRGHVFITDFGLAGLAGQVEGARSAGAPRRTWRPNNWQAGKFRFAAISTRWAWCSTRCSRARVALKIPSARRAAPPSAVRTRRGHRTPWGRPSGRRSGSR
jgi:hypothetical protein